jgi:hypothetical protein
MKNQILTILFTLLIFSAQAQTEQGKFIVGGNAGFSFSKDKQKVGNTATDRWKHTNIYLTPNVGYFVIANFAIGAKLDLSSNTSRLNDGLNLAGGRKADSKNNTTSFSLGPWARYYFPVGTKAALFGDANVGIGVSRYKYRTVNGSGNVVTITQPSSTATEFSIGPGYTYFITNNVGIEGLLQYKFYRSAYSDDGTDVKTVNTNSGLYFNIGLQVYL